MAARYGHLINKWTVAAVAALAVMAALLAAALPAGAQEAPPTIPGAITVFDYNENGTGNVVTYTARDPENKPVFWTLGGTDAEDFTIKDGTLRFKKSPNYEVPTDRQHDVDGNGTIVQRDPNANPPVLQTEGLEDNTYHITVRFSAGGQDGTAGDDDYNGDDLGQLELTVNVINVNEPGTVVVSPMQPQVGTQLTAILTDEDNVLPGTGEWQWARADSKDGTFTDIPSLSNRMTYRPTIADLNKYLRVTVVYVDRAGADSRTVQGVSTAPVRKDIVTSNQPPKYPDQSTLTGSLGPEGTADNVDRGRTNTDRFILETASAGDRVGAPVTAFDDKSDVEKLLTYSLRDSGGQVVADNDGNPNTPAHSDGDAASFDIDAATGQITVSARADLDAEFTNAQNVLNPPYNVVVRVVDGDGDTEDITVTIHVLLGGEPPEIDRVYATGRVPATGGVQAGHRAPTEMSHYETDRTPRDATVIDADLDTSVLNYDNDPPTLLEGDAYNAALQPATYYATDPDAGDEIEWSLEGPDAGSFELDVADDNGSATLEFGAGPDFEQRGDANKDNIYEVTIVVTDTYGMTDKLPVTVKVINSTEDNQPGRVGILNRQPEVATELKAKFLPPPQGDPDGPFKEMKWQWYRNTSEVSVTARTNDSNPRCPLGYNPHDPLYTADTDPATDVRYFISNTFLNDTTPDWEAIPGASGTGMDAKYTPGYDEDSGGTKTTTGGGNEALVETWTGGDIQLVRTTAVDTGTVTNAWSNHRCLRVAFTYRDAVDRTHTDADPDATDNVDQTLEATYAGSEYPVKPIDEGNDAPVFEDPDGNSTDTYRALAIVENTAAGALIIDRAGQANLAATDVATSEDDPDAQHDVLTYSLSGRDAGAFAITGSIGNPPADASPANDGVLTLTVAPNYEGQREYRVRITATDPSGDSDYVDVIVNITNVNEPPVWEKKKAEVLYAENDTVDVSTYLATDPEGSGITYSLVTGAVDLNGDGDNLDPGEIAAGEITDRDEFSLGSISGKLRFKASPNYEDPQDTGAFTGNNLYNRYQVGVQARVADDRNPPHIIYLAVTVIVTNVNEAPVFSKTADALDISENADDPNKEPPLAAGYLYLLNRGAGKPAADKPESPHLDVGIPMVAVDDDNTWTARDANGAAKDYTGGGISRGASNAPYSATVRPIQLIDGLYYELVNADAVPFHIVPATGQILTLEKLDHEATSTYNVMVKATDPWGLYGTIPVTINVTDVDEVPVGGLLTLTGSGSHTFAENNTDTVLPGYYTISGATAAVTWSLEGADSSHFALEGTGRSRTLAFKSPPPNFEMPRGKAVSADNTNDYKVTVKASAGTGDEMQTKTVDVTVTVTNVEEAGAVTLSATGASVGTALTATLTDDDGVVGAIEWQWYRADTAAGTGSAIIGSQARNASYTPVTPDDVGKFLRAMASYTDGMGPGKSASASIETAVADANVAPAFDAETATREVAENTAAAANIGDPITATDPNGDEVTYSLSGTDAASFDIGETTGQLMTSAALDYETKSSYSVTVMAADPHGLSGSIAVTVNITNVNEDGMVALSPDHPRVGSAITATPTDPDSDPTGPTYQWSYSTAMAGPFTPYPAETTASITPTDADIGRYLSVTVGYTDVHGEQTASVVTASMVSRNAAPMFADDTASRSVDENTAAGTPIGAPVTATDADNDTPAYTLGGTDAASFDINGATGQLMTKAALNYEVKPEKTSYSVTVTATDPYNASDSIAVTIMVGNVNEAPAFAAATASRSVAENTAAGMNIGDAVTATDEDTDDTLTYTLGGTDAASFGIVATSGQLQTKADLDYETKSSYEVTVTAADKAGASDSIEVTITVTDVNDTTPPDPNADLIAKYDTNGTDGIQLDEVEDAINDYFGGVADAPSLTEVERLIEIYFNS